MKAKRKRPECCHTMSVTVPRQMKQRMKDEAEGMCVNTSAFVRAILLDWISKADEAKGKHDAQAS